MSKTIALLSGKGGSGKTSLALSISSLLAKVGLNVLLIDCDLSTNGATYFFEDKINEKSASLISFFDYFNLNVGKSLIKSISTALENIDCKGTYININRHFDFLPSVTTLSGNLQNTYRFVTDHKLIMNSLNKYFRTKYDVIIFDCEAGYSDILNTILPFIDINLIVMEADAISSSSIRSLFLKVGNGFKSNKIYQVFNKASKEEYEIYSKVSGGTIFTNIETIMFDWKIRRDFSVAQIPDMDRTSAHYGKQVYNICKILFKEEKMQNALEKYESTIQMNEILEQEEQLKELIASKKRGARGSRWELTRKLFYQAFSIGVFSFVIVFLSLAYEDRARYFDNSILSLFIILLCVLCFVMSAMEFITNIIRPKDEISDEMQKLYELRKQREALLEETENSNIKKNNIIGE